ncbi:MAG: hypothetical protein ACR2NB_01415 [Solirubrobacteraceae bacterium]
MSEANNVWRVDAGGIEHEIEVEHSTTTGKYEVRLDGTVVGNDRMWARKQNLDFDVAGHPARVTLEFKYGGMGAGSALHLDERYVEPLRK